MADDLTLNSGIGGPLDARAVVDILDRGVDDMSSLLDCGLAPGDGQAGELAGAIGRRMIDELVKQVGSPESVAASILYSAAHIVVRYGLDPDDARATFDRAIGAVMATQAAEATASDDRS